MSRSKNRRENADKIRKQTQHPHGKVTSLEEFAEEYDKEHSAKGEQQQS